MGLVSKSKTWSDGETLNAADLNQGFDDIVNVVNGNLDDNNVNSVSITKISNPYKFYAYLPSNQTLSSGTSTQLNLTAEMFDPNNNYDAANKKYVVPVTGYYLLIANALFYYGGSNFNDPRLDVFIVVNGTSQLAASNRFETGYVSSQGLTTTASGILYLTANDEVTVNAMVKFSSGSPYIHGSAKYTYFMGQLLSV